MQIYLVTADHVAPQYACTNVRAVVKEYGDGSGLFYANIPGYGCSKNYSSPERAIAGMLAEHACTNIRIVAETAPAAPAGRFVAYNRYSKPIFATDEESVLERFLDRAERAGFVVTGDHISTGLDAAEYAAGFPTKES